VFHLTANTFFVMLSILLILAGATVYCRIQQRQQPERDYTELSQRIHSWWIIIGLIFFVLLLPIAGAVAAIAVLSYLALREFLSIIPTRLADRRAIFWSYLMIPLQYYWIAIGWYGMFVIFIPVYIFLLLPFRLVVTGETEGFINAVGTIQWGIMLTVFSISHLAYLLVLPAEHNPLGGGAGLILYLLLLTEGNDVAQYVWGKSLGRRKIVPTVSPNKTWEGFLGGVATTMVLGAVLSRILTPLTLSEGLMAGLLIGGSGFVGDVCVSAVKRDLQIKDTGTMIPGHGGILDRVDSLTYTAPLFFHYLFHLHY
jgi:phosphatidate cytidylyltransferase